MTLTMVIIIPLLILLLGFVAVRKMGSLFWKWVGGVITLSLTYLAGSLLLFPPHRPLDVTGPYAVHEVIRFYSRPTDDPALATSPGTRELPVNIWFPATEQHQKMPLVIYSHGSFGIPEANATLFRELASHGFTVVSAAHPAHSFVARLQSGQKVYVDRSFLNEVMAIQGDDDIHRRYQDLRRWNTVRTDDLNAVIDAVMANEAQYAELQGIISKDIVAIGHSMGGMAALTLGRTRPEVEAVVALEAPFVGDITGLEEKQFIFNKTPYPVPVLHFYSDAVWPHLSEPDLDEYEMNARLLQISDPRFKNVHLAGHGHLGLTDLSLESPSLTNLLDNGLDTGLASEALTQINRETLDFLKHVVR